MFFRRSLQVIRFSGLGAGNEEGCDYDIDQMQSQGY
jgi:hypothetical protein